MSHHTPRAVRIRSELKKAGVGTWARRSLEARHLPTIIHDDETINAAVFGVCSVGFAMLIATNKRIIFLDSKPLFNTQEEITYRVVSGVRVTDQVLFSTITLETRIGRYVFRFVDPSCARKFERYIESNWLEPTKSGPKLFGFDKAKEVPPAVHHAAMDDDIRRFLFSHNRAVLSTLSESGEVHGSPVHYLFESDGNFYVLAEPGSNKAKNIASHTQVSLTIYDNVSLKTLQVNGTAELDNDPERRNYLFVKVISSDLDYVNIHSDTSNHSVIRIAPTKFRMLS